MATKKRKISKTSPFWKPENPGDSHSGVLQGYQKTERQDGSEGAAVMIGGKLFGQYGVLKAVSSVDPKDLKIGKTKISVTYIGKVKTKGKRTVNEMEVTIDGKLIETSGFTTITDSIEGLSIVNAALEASGMRKKK